jgi:hypothetical protein
VSDELPPRPAAPRPAPAPPRPVPGPGRRPGPRPGPYAGPRPPAPAAQPTGSGFGRVGADGTVYVRTTEGERAVGSYPGAGPEEALAYFARKYDEVVAQVALFEQRLSTADLSVAEIDATLAKLRGTVKDLNAVGDLAALATRVEALAPVAGERHARADAARQAAREQARARRTALVDEAEKLAAVPPEKTQWRVEGQRMKELFEAWRAEQKGGPAAGSQPDRSEHGQSEHGQSEHGRNPARLDRRTEDELWKRFSHARSAFDRKRRQHFAQLDGQHAEARATKEALVKEAEALQTSRDWAPTATGFKRLMDRWRTAGRAARKDDDALWQRFKAAQDTFFAARGEVLAAQDQEFAANLAVKEELLARAETLLPITDLQAAKSTLRDIQGRWESAGKVPRGDLDRIERRMKVVEDAIRRDEDSRWANNNPEARARARDAVDQLEAGIADLETRLRRATERGSAKQAAEAQAALDTRREWLVQARKALHDFGG